MKNDVNTSDEAIDLQVHCLDVAGHSLQMGAIPLILALRDERDGLREEIMKLREILDEK